MSYSWSASEFPKEKSKGVSLLQFYWETVTQHWGFSRPVPLSTSSGHEKPSSSITITTNSGSTFFSFFTPFDTNVLNSDTPNILFLFTFMNHYHTHSHTHKSMCTVYLHTFTTQMWVNISYMDPMTSYDYSFMSFHIHVNMRIILMAGQPTPM